MNNNYTATAQYGELHFNRTFATAEDCQWFKRLVTPLHPDYEFHCSSFNPHGYGSPRFSVYGIKKSLTNRRNSDIIST
jgi:hypothetical protein